MNKKDDFGNTIVNNNKNTRQIDRAKFNNNSKSNYNTSTNRDNLNDTLNRLHSNTNKNNLRNRVSEEKEARSDKSSKDEIKYGKANEILPKSNNSKEDTSLAGNDKYNRNKLLNEKIDISNYAYELYDVSYDKSNKVKYPISKRSVDINGLDKVLDKDNRNDSYELNVDKNLKDKTFKKDVKKRQNPKTDVFDNAKITNRNERNRLDTSKDNETERSLNKSDLLNLTADESILVKLATKQDNSKLNKRDDLLNDNKALNELNKSRAKHNPFERLFQNKPKVYLIT